VSVGDSEPTLEGNRPSLTKEERWVDWWAVVVALLFVVELFFDGFPEGTEGAAWGEARRPLLIVGILVLALFLLGAAQGQWGRRADWEKSSVRLSGLGACPRWFAFLAFGLGIVGLALYVYAVFRSLSEGGSLHVVERRASLILMAGSVGFFRLIKWVSTRGWSDGEASSRPQ